MQPFTARIAIIGINPYVLIPDETLEMIFVQAGKRKGSIPVSGTIDGHPFIQTLVRYSGEWRLYLNGPMRKDAGKDVGDTVSITLQHDPVERTITEHPKLQQALDGNPEAKSIYQSLSPSLRKEIIRYINHLKTEETVEKNCARAIRFLLGKEHFIGRDKP